MKLFSRFFFALFVWIMIASCVHAPLSRAPASEELKAIVVTTECEIQCSNESKPNRFKSNEEIFNPYDTPIKAVNDQLVPNTTMRFQMLADYACEALAIDYCKSKNRIVDVKALGLSSGKWKAKLPLDCSNSKNVISPYDPHASPQWASLPDDRPNFGSLEDYEFSFLSALQSKESSSATTCAHPIHANTCFGDCMSEIKSEWFHTLSSTHPDGRGNETVCADILFKQLKKESLPRALREIECRRFFYTELQKSQRKDLSCSAYRASIPDCENF